MLRTTLAALALILLFTPALGDDKQAQALIEQANQLDNQGDHDGAIALYTRAMALGDEFEARMDRSFAYASSDRFAEAFQDLDRAQQLKPHDSAPVSARYWFDFELFQFPAVIVTINQLNGLTPPDPYAPLLRFIAQSRLGQNANAQLQKTVTPSARNSWPQAAALMFLNQVSPDQLLSWVQYSGNQQAGCEAPFYVGEYFLIHRNTQLAQVAFSETQRPECRVVSEYYASQMELTALQDSLGS